MNEQTTTSEVKRKRPSVWQRVQLSPTLGLTIVWILLLGEISLGSVLFGVLLALGVQLVFPLPRVPELDIINPIGAIVLIATTFGGLLIVSFQVAWQVLAFWRPTKNAMIEIDLASDNEFTTAMTAEIVSIVPGSIVVEASDGKLLLHVFDASSQRSIDRARQQALATERRVVKTFNIERLERKALRRNRT